jgi:hypothetical protein
MRPTTHYIFYLSELSPIPQRYLHRINPVAFDGGDEEGEVFPGDFFVLFRDFAEKVEDEAAEFLFKQKQYPV